jgi:hypothetical protein
VGNDKSGRTNVDVVGGPDEAEELNPQLQCPTTGTFCQELESPRVLAKTPKKYTGTYSVTLTFRNAGTPLLLRVRAPLGRFGGGVVDVAHVTSLLFAPSYPLIFA